MEFTEKIGRVNLLSSKIGLGTNKVGGHNLFPNLRDKDGEEVVKTALDLGITLLDTAYMYGLGRSEEIIGDVIKQYDRSKIVIATKAAQDPNNELAINNKPEFLKKSVDEALERLQTDYIDIFYIHFPDENTPKEEAVAALNEVKKAGKIKTVGVSNFTLDQIKEANKFGGVDIVEDHYSLLHREAEEELFPYLEEHQISFVPYFPLESGLLTGKYTKADSSQFKKYTAEQFEEALQAIDSVRKIAEKHDASVAQTILAWYLKHPAITAVIPGARKAEQVENNVGALHVDLSKEEFEAIDQLFR